MTKFDVILYSFGNEQKEQKTFLTNDKGQGLIYITPNNYLDIWLKQDEFSANSAEAFKSKFNDIYWNDDANWGYKIMEIVDITFHHIPDGKFLR